MKSTYMLYSNNDGESVAFGDIQYISEHILTAKPNLKSVLKILNAQDDLMLMQVVSKHGQES
jgi:hypothetical protein